VILKNVEEETLIHHNHLHKTFKLVKKSEFEEESNTHDHDPQRK
jgi:hypothetical protein